MPLKFRGWEFTGDVKPVFDERKERSARAHKIAVLAAQILDMFGETPVVEFYTCENGG